MHPAGAGLQPDPLRMPGHEWHSSAGPFQCRDGFLHADNSLYLQDALAHECDLWEFSRKVHWLENVSG